MKKLIEITILAILSTAAIFSLIYTFLTDYTVGIRFYSGLIGLGIVITTRFFSEKISNYLLGLLLLAGTFRLLHFFYIDHSIGLSINILKVKFNFILLIAFIFYLVVNGPEISKLFGETEMSEEDKKNQLEKNIEMYMLMHKNKSVDELKDLINNPEGYVDSAVIAAKRLLENKTYPNNVS